MSGGKTRGAGPRQAALLSALGRSTARSPFPEMEILLRRAIQEELTERQRTCLLLYYGDRRTMPEIAGILNLTCGTVSKHIRKGTDRLRRVLRYSPAGAKMLM